MATPETFTAADLAPALAEHAGECRQIIDAELALLTDPPAPAVAGLLQSIATTAAQLQDLTARLAAAV